MHANFADKAALLRRPFLFRGNLFEGIRDAILGRTLRLTLDPDSGRLGALLRKVFPALRPNKKLVRPAAALRNSMLRDFRKAGITYQDLVDSCD